VLNYSNQRPSCPKQPSQYQGQGQQYQGQCYPYSSQHNGYPAQNASHSGNQHGYIKYGQPHGKEWYQNEADRFNNYQEIDPRLVNPNYPHRQQNGPHVSPSRHRNQSNGFSSPNSMSSHDSYAQMRSIFPGAESPQNSVTTGVDKSSVSYGDAMLHASKC
jgi:hypothetical protein